MWGGPGSACAEGPGAHLSGGDAVGGRDDGRRSVRGQAPGGGLAVAGKLLKGQRQRHIRVREPSGCGMCVWPRVLRLQVR